MCTKCEKTSCLLKKVIVKGRQDGKCKKENLKTWSEEVTDILIKCFQSHE